MSNDTTREGLLPIGTTLSNKKYKIEAHLSSGGFGNTYIATDTAFDERVAIKELFIKGGCGRDSDGCEVSVSLTENKRSFRSQQEKFRKEARRLRMLTNPHIVRVFDLFDENGTSYYVMELIDGESLSQRLKRTGKPMTEQEVSLILPQVLDALQTVHAEGIWHLDLKPANIMLDRKGNAILIDFGASKQLRNADGDSLSTSSSLAYTQGYAPSEQMEQNIEKFGPWTDLYALGATLYNLLTRNQPPSPSDIDEDAEKALPMPEHISKKMHDLILWMMKPNRRMRPQSVANVKQFLIEVPTGQLPPKQKAKEKPVGTNDDTQMKDADQQGQPHKPKKKPSRKSKPIAKYVIAAAAILIVAGSIFAMSRCRGQKPVESEIIDSVEVALNETPNEITPSTTNVTNEAIRVDNAPDNMKSFTYSGTVDNDLPNGEGKARFYQYGDIPASTYEGEFLDGLCHGQGTQTFTNGDKFTGRFAKGYYAEGTYAMADGSYFRGTYRNGNPWSGAWYNANGQKDADVVDGEEK